MRGKFLVVAALITAILLLTSCTQVITSAADELRMFRWHGEYENGNKADLFFDGTDAVLRLTLPGGTLTLSGLCAATDDRLIVCDEASGFNYSFGYRLYGDRVELSYNGAVLVLDKIQ